MQDAEEEMKKRWCVEYHSQPMEPPNILREHVARYSYSFSYLTARSYVTIFDDAWGVVFQAFGRELFRIPRRWMP